MPKFLRYEGQVRNRRLGKRDTSLLIKDIWQEKAAHDAEVRKIVRDQYIVWPLFLSRRGGNCLITVKNLTADGNKRVKRASFGYH